MVLGKTDWRGLRDAAGSGERVCHALSPLFPVSNILLALLVVIGDSSIKRFTAPFGFLKPWAVRGLYQIFVALHAESACIATDDEVTQLVHFAAVLALATVGGLYFVSGLLCLKRVKQAIDGTGGSDAEPLSGKDSLRGNKNKYLQAEGSHESQVKVEVQPSGAKKSRRGMC